MKSLTLVAKELNKNRSRLKEIITILHKYHLTGWLNNIKHPELMFFSYKKETKNIFYDLPIGERMCLAFSEIGTTFIKLGQILSSRPDLLGKESCIALSQLQNNAPTDTFDYIDRIAKTFSTDIIENFDSTPLASGSIAQAHKATHTDGTPLIIKIMHEGIETKIKADLEILKALSILAEYFDTPLKGYSPVSLVKSFAESLEGELDFNQEVHNLDIFCDQFKENKNIIFPKSFHSISSHNVIAMECFSGETLSNLDYSNIPDNEKGRLAHVIADTFFEMIFKNQFYHADPHAGNLIYRPDKTIAIIDCGMVGTLTTRESKDIEDLMLAVVDQDINSLCRTIINMGFTPKSLDEEAFSKDVEQLIENYFMSKGEQLNMKNIVTDFNAILYDHAIIMSPSISMLLRLLVILEGTSHKLNANFSIFELIKKYYIHIKIKRLNPLYMYTKTKRKIQDATHVAEDIPRLILKYIKQLEKNDFSINMKHHNLSEAVDKLVLAMLASSIIIGSMVLISTRVQPLVGDVSILGLVGLCLAAPFIYKTIKRLKK